MNIVIEHENTQLYIVLPMSSASAAAELLANARVFKQDNYPRHENMVESETGLVLRFDSGERFKPKDKQVIEAQEKAAKADGARWETEAKWQKSQKELAETKAALEAIKSVTVCKTVEPEPDAEETTEPMPVDSSQDVPF